MKELESHERAAEFDQRLLILEITPIIKESESLVGFGQLRIDGQGALDDRFHLIQLFRRKRARIKVK